MATFSHNQMLVRITVPHYGLCVQLALFPEDSLREAHITRLVDGLPLSLCAHYTRSRVNCAFRSCVRMTTIPLNCAMESRGPHLSSLPFLSQRGVTAISLLSAYLSTCLSRVYSASALPFSECGQRIGQGLFGVIWVACFGLLVIFVLFFSSSAVCAQLAAKVDFFSVAVVILVF